MSRQRGGLDDRALPLAGRAAVVTGVSRRIGIGFAVARRLADGAGVLAHSWRAQDETQPWGADPVGPEGVLAALRAAGGHVEQARQTSPTRTHRRL